MFKLIIVVLLVVILVSLAASMLFLIRDHGSSKRPVMALTIRIALSLLLFALLLVGYFTGALRPHGLLPTPGTQSSMPQSQ